MTRFFAAARLQQKLPTVPFKTSPFIPPSLRLPSDEHLVDLSPADGSVSRSAKFHSFLAAHLLSVSPPLTATFCFLKLDPSPHDPPPARIRPFDPCKFGIASRSVPCRVCLPSLPSGFRRSILNFGRRSCYMIPRPDRPLFLHVFLKATPPPTLFCRRPRHFQSRPRQEPTAQGRRHLYVCPPPWSLLVYMPLRSPGLFRFSPGEPVACLRFISLSSPL